jgi:cytochrome b subunit of formate dehydrogenase
VANVSTDSQSLEALAGISAPAPAPRRLQYRRFSAFQRWVHFFIMVSFTVLVFTGMPLRYSDQGWAQWEMRQLGGIQTAGVIHRFAAMIMVACVLCMLVFFIGILVKRRGRYWGPGTMVPNRRDWQDLMAMWRWFLGGPRPVLQFDRYSFYEKGEFWAASAGVSIMCVTGAMLWYPELTTRFLPGIVLNFAIVNHSGGALLAMGFVFVFWHVFHAHLRPEVFPMDKAMFDGGLPLEEYAHERPLEYERRVHEGTLHEVLVPEVSARRRRIENAIWGVITTVSLVVWFAFVVFIVWVIGFYLGLW